MMVYDFSTQNRKFYTSCFFETHLKAILKKLAVPNRTQAILMLARAEQ